MEKSVKFESIQPRFLRYRSHYKLYLLLLLTLGGLILSAWGFKLTQHTFSELLQLYSYEMIVSGLYFSMFACFYFFWLKSRLHQSVQVFSEHILIHKPGHTVQLNFSDVSSIGVVCWSVFYLRMQDGTKHYFSASLERVDYIWEGLYSARRELFEGLDYASFRTRLVQYDHHQKRKEWFFRHKIVDLFNWIILPTSFMAMTYLVQSREIMIHQQGMYFFRLGMYALLVLFVTTFLCSIVLKKFVFDKRIKFQMNNQPEDKIRDMEFEGVVLHRSKMLQMITAAFVFSILMRTEVNLFSVTKVKEDLSSFNVPQGQTLLIDNRFNCLICKYSVQDGDLVVFGRGVIGQVMATQGDMVGQISQDTRGRIIASENIQEVPRGHVAIKLANNKEIVMVKLQDLIGKIQK